jgi:hypothetical protein
MTYGDLQSVVLYRDVGRNQWRWAIYDTEGLWDGLFPTRRAGRVAFVKRRDAAACREPQASAQGDL